MGSWQPPPSPNPRDATWLRRGFRDADGTGTDSAAMVLRDGTLVSPEQVDFGPVNLVAEFIGGEQLIKELRGFSAGERYAELSHAGDELPG